MGPLAGIGFLFLQLFVWFYLLTTAPITRLIPLFAKMYVLSYACGMLSTFICNSSPFKILRALYYSTPGCSLRELSQVTGLSIGAVQDNTQKLLDQGLIQKEKKANKVYFTLCLEKNDYQLLCDLITESDQSILKLRAEKTSTKKLYSILNLGRELKQVRNAHGTA